MLSALDHRRPFGLIGDMDDPFHPQQIGTEVLLQCIEQQLQRLARDRRFTDKTERGDVAVVRSVVGGCDRRATRR